jgi:hypothetical protein
MGESRRKVQQAPAASCLLSTKKPRPSRAGFFEYEKTLLGFGCEYQLNTSFVTGVAIKKAPAGVGAGLTSANAVCGAVIGLTSLCLYKRQTAEKSAPLPSFISALGRYAPPLCRKYPRQQPARSFRANPASRREEHPHTLRRFFYGASGRSSSLPNYASATQPCPISSSKRSRLIWGRTLLLVRWLGYVCGDGERIARSLCTNRKRL